MFNHQKESMMKETAAESTQWLIKRERLLADTQYEGE
jgi:hypothetical protein